MQNNKILVRKSDDQLEFFDSQKLKKSLLKASASILVTNDILKEIENKFVGETTTDEIYQTAFKILKQKEKPSALRYSIKRSILSLGPTGFPFEKFMAQIFQAKGFKTKTGIMLKGQCIEHEVDLFATDEDDSIIAEIKFHNDTHIKTDTRVALYVKARFDDLKNKKKINRCLIITNTDFTFNAIKYSKCVGVELLSWNYPQKGNLHQLIDDTKIFPISILTSLDNNQKKALIEKNIITCNQLLKNGCSAKVKDEIEKLSIK